MMIRLGAEPSKMREIELDDVFLSRLQLLIIMSKAYLNGYPLGRHRIKSILENAKHVKMEAVGLDEDLELFGEDESTENGLGFDSAFYQRVKLLAVMAEAIAKGHALEQHKKEALEKNLDAVCESITFNKQVSDIQFLKVA
ncbi:MAG: hypothetical protein JRF32_05330 [Deltaproteobacteria bacterium]|nr:hypothetical protein [Deltaproteobacteria bacterium]MBW2297012.1 hypothetical protein [Deltaproteobacteria bacterium]MBW2611751.1 hypothetical protein [Deltaproteobacteria bacterium]MBW2633954.1 hypothetical protein [Deltaproteobacteria bacterium]MBW2676436.1 hypothetical protein [Deltaproteobacteria bacterium]